MRNKSKPISRRKNPPENNPSRIWAYGLIFSYSSQRKIQLPNISPYCRAYNRKLENVENDWRTCFGSDIVICLENITMWYSCIHETVSVTTSCPKRKPKIFETQTSIWSKNKLPTPVYKTSPKISPPEREVKQILDQGLFLELNDVDMEHIHWYGKMRNKRQIMHSWGLKFGTIQNKLRICYWHVLYEIWYYSERIVFVILNVVSWCLSVLKKILLKYIFLL